MSIRFVTELQYRENLEKQCGMAPEALAQLRQCGVSEDKDLRLVFFFYTNSGATMKALADALQLIGYEVEYGESAADDGTFIVTGWTSAIRMTEDVIISWTEKMCRIGFEHDAEFDGWGTNPNQ